MTWPTFQCLPAVLSSGDRRKNNGNAVATNFPQVFLLAKNSRSFNAAVSCSLVLLSKYSYDVSTNVHVFSDLVETDKFYAANPVKTRSGQ